MKKVAFALIMSVRLVALIAIVAGICLWTGKFAASQQTLILTHFVIGFIVVADLIALAIVGILQRVLPLGLLAIVAAICLPATGFMQIATIGPNVGGPQIGHIVVVLAAIGLAEAIAARVKRAA